MSQDDQEALAAQWAAQLEEEEAGQPGGDAGAPEVEAGDAGAAAGDQERSPVDDETLAAQWAEALAEDEEDKSGPSTFGGAGAGGGGTGAALSVAGRASFVPATGRGSGKGICKRP